MPHSLCDKVSWDKPVTDGNNLLTENSDKNERQSASWDLSNAFRNYSTLAATQIAAAFFSFASVWLATRFLGTEGYGGIVAVIAASQVAQIFVNWTGVSAVRFGVGEFVESGKINKSFWTRSLIFLPNTAVFLAFSFLWLPIISNWLKLPPDAGWYIVGHFTALAFWFHVQNALQGAKLLRLQGVLIAIERILIFLIMLILTVSGNLTSRWALAAYILSPLLMVFVGLFQLRGLISWRVEFDWELLKKMLKFSIPLIPYGLVGYFGSSYLDAIFISQFLSKSDLAIYSVAYQIMGILMQFSILANMLLLPLFVTLQTNNQGEKVNYYIRNILPTATLVWGFGCVIFAIGGIYILPLVFGVEFTRSSEILLILTITAVVNVPIPLGYASLINANSLTFISTASIVFLSIVNFAGNFILIPRFGLIGSAWATNLGYGISLVVIVVCLHKKFPLKGNWTMQAILPAILGLSLAAWTGNLILAFLTSLVSTVLLVFRHWSSIMETIKFLLKNNPFAAKSP